MPDTAPPASPLRPPEPGHAQIWRWRLDNAPAPDPLSPGERERAARLVQPADRRSSIVARAGLRTILARYLGLSPAEVPLTAEPGGKPRLEPSGGPDLRFNLSHAGAVAVLAIMAGCEVGVDIEPVAPVAAGLPDLLAPAEAAALMRLDEASRREAFARTWTRKESWLKARGTGLMRDLAGFEVTVPPAPARLVHADGEPGEEERWSLRDFEPWPGIVGCVAAPVQSLSVTMLDLAW